MRSGVASDLPPVDFEKMEHNLIMRLTIEILHNIQLISDQEYYTRFIDNAEVLDRDYKIWKELLEFGDLPEEEA